MYYGLTGGCANIFQLLSLTCGNEYFERKDVAHYLPLGLQRSNDIDEHILWIKEIHVSIANTPMTITSTFAKKVST